MKEIQREIDSNSLGGHDKPACVATLHQFYYLYSKMEGFPHPKLSQAKAASNNNGERKTCETMEKLHRKFIEKDEKRTTKSTIFLAKEIIAINKVTEALSKPDFVRMVFLLCFYGLQVL